MDLEQLEKLNELKEKGIITQDEFEEKKKELLGSVSTKTSSKSTTDTKEKSLWNYFILNMTEKYACFNGRARRKEFWGFTLFYSLLLNIIPSLMMVLTQSVETANVIYWILFLVMFLPSLGLLIRRLHDVNFSGWWSIFPYTLMFPAQLISTGVQNDIVMGLMVILFIASCVPLVVIFFNSETKENKYGPIPDGILSSKTEGK